MAVIATCLYNIIGALILAFGDVHDQLLPVLDGALLSCTILLPDKSTVGVYFNLAISCEHLNAYHVIVDQYC